MKTTDYFDLSVTVTGILREIGIPAHILGHRYIRQAIIVALDDSEAIYAVTKVLYPSVANTFLTTPSRVERAIRHAIEVAWDRGDAETLRPYFGHTDPLRRPTNSEFIAAIVQYLSPRAA